MATDPTNTEMLRIIVRNQRLMMLAITNIIHNGPQGTGTGYHAEKLTKRVKDMERVWDWIASPGERIT